jgi:pyruvate carboxylase
LKFSEAAKAWEFVLIKHQLSQELFIKVITHSQNHQSVYAKMILALKEFRIRGAKTNISFLINVLENKEIVNGTLDTSFIDAKPELFQCKQSQNRVGKLLNYLGTVMVNGKIKFIKFI